jgi:hypothetical protein
MTLARGSRSSGGTARGDSLAPIVHPSKPDLAAPPPGAEANSRIEQRRPASGQAAIAANVAKAPADTTPSGGYEGGFPARAMEVPNCAGTKKRTDGHRPRGVSSRATMARDPTGGDRIR